MPTKNPAAEQMQPLVAALERLVTTLSTQKPPSVTVTNTPPAAPKVEMIAQPPSVTVAPAKPVSYDFEVVARDNNGRIKKIRATPIH